MESSSDDEIFILACILGEEEEREKEEEEEEVNDIKKHKKKRVWVKPHNQQRHIFGVFDRLFLKLQDNDRKFFQYFRMSFNKFSELLCILTPALTFQNTRFRASISKEERLAVTLRYLATGEKFRAISRYFHMGETTVGSIIHSTCVAISDLLGKIVMPMPSKEQWKLKEEQFKQIWSFPNCLAVIEAKHVLTDKAPKPKTGSSYFSHGNSFSTILLAFIDAQSKFIAVDIGPFGINSGGIFSTSELGKNMSKDQLNFPEPKPLPGMSKPIPHVCIGGESFPLFPNLLKPYPLSQASNQEDMKVFNRKLSNTRQVVENCFDNLVSRFHVYQKRFQISPEKFDKIVLATCCLHNFLVDDVCYWSKSNDRDIFPQAFQSTTGIGGSAKTASLRVRDEFKKYFNSLEGALESKE